MLISYKKDKIVDSSLKITRFDLVVTKHSGQTRNRLLQGKTKLTEGRHGVRLQNYL